MPPQDEQLPPEIEVQLSGLLADASDQLLQKNMSEAQQEQAQQQAQDPLVQMQQQEMQLKQGELERKTAKDQADNEIAKAELQIESAKLESDERQALQKLIADGVAKEGTLNAQQMIEGAKLAVTAGIANKNNEPNNQ